MASATTALRRKHDSTVYPGEDFIGEGSLERFVSELLREQIERWLHQHKKDWFVGANQFFFFPTDTEAEHAALEVEHAARVEAEVEIARLRAELKRLRKP